MGANFEIAEGEFRELHKIVKPVELLLRAHVAALLIGQNDRVDRIESRTKSFESIRDNYVRDYGEPRSQLTLEEFLRDANDLVGVRVVVYYNDDVDKTVERLAAAFPQGKRDEKLTIHDANRGSRFGYRAVHINFVFCDQPILHLYSRTGVGIELQVRTIFSDAWARHSHKLVYKDQTPRSDGLIREFAATAALLETLDEKMAGMNGMPPAPLQPLSFALNWSSAYEESCRIVGSSLEGDDLRTVFIAASESFTENGEEGRLTAFLEDIRRAWSRFGHIDFSRYGYVDPAAQLKMALYGINGTRYETLIPLHLRKRVSNLLQVGARLPKMETTQRLSIRDDNNVIVPYEFADEVLERCRGMESDWKRFVVETDAMSIVPIEQVVLSRARMNGIRNAIERMKEAASGSRPRREPIRVVQKDDRYVVIDGNSTVVVFAAIGIKKIPVEIRDRIE